MVHTSRHICFAKRKSLGRGFICRAKWFDSNIKVTEYDLKRSLQARRRFGSIIPFTWIWYLLRPFFGSRMMRILNFIQFYLVKLSKRILGNRKKRMLFSDFNFMHQKIPNFKNIYRPDGFHEFQPLIPGENGLKNITQLLQMCQSKGFQSMLCVIKLHSPDNFLISYQGEGYSLGIDVPGKGRDKADIDCFARELFGLVTDMGGRVFLAKDAWLMKEYFEKMYPEYKNFLTIKKEMDPGEIFYSEMYKRLFK